jgi:outer membrane protein insertion porin family
MHKISTYLLVIIGLFFFVGCSNTRHLPKGEKLYTGHKVEFKKDTINRNDIKVLREDLQGMVRPKPNTKLLGMRVKLFLYNLAGSPRRKSGGLRNLLRNRFGEPPVLASSVNLKSNEDILQNRLENLGFFHATVKGDTIVRRRKVRAKYVADPGPQYHIHHVDFPSDSTALGKAIADISSKTLLKPGDPYNLDVVKGERNRIDQALKERGFYFFGPDYLIARVDSTIGNHLIDFYLAVKPTAPQRAKQAYKINEIYIYPDYNLANTEADTSKANAVYIDGFHVIDNKKLFKPVVFSRSMFFKPGDLYNRKEHNLALNRLVTMGSFKFVNNRFEDIGTPDARLDAYYYLTPYPKKSLHAEALGTTKSNNATGSQINFTWRNRNAFRGAEQLSLTAYIATETQISSTQRGYATNRFGGDLTVSIPRFIVPFRRDINTNHEFVPHTKLNVGFEYLNKAQLYGVNSFRGSAGYEWKSNILRQHELYPVSVTYVQPQNITKQYQDSIDQNPQLAISLRKPIEQQFIIGSTYSFLYNDQPDIARQNHIYFNGTVDLSGNILGLLSGANVKSGSYQTLFGSRFSQYIRLDEDFRYYYKLGRYSTWANRAFVGFGLPYGNSTELPFVKQYFTGGSSSNRAFRSRSVGPGTYHPDDADAMAFLPEQSGDIKLELNTEYRTKLSGIVNGALFIDAGNVWLYNDNPGKPGGKFTGSFYKELAVGAGFGLRFDITFLLIRADMAFPLRKPWLPEKQRWALGKSGVFNLAIGYPF